MSRVQRIVLGSMVAAPTLGGLAVALAIIMGAEPDNSTVRMLYFIYFCILGGLCAVIITLPWTFIHKFAACFLSFIVMCSEVVCFWFIWAIVGFIKFRGFEGVQ